MDIQYILDPVEFLHSIVDDFSKFSPFIHPMCKTFVKPSGMESFDINSEDNEVAIPLNEIFRHLFPKGSLLFGLKIVFGLGPYNTFS